MLLIILSYLGGALTIVSPCILPVLPFVFARTGQPFRRSGLPLLAGMALTFALVATLAAVGGGWVVQANQYGRWAAMALMAFFGLTLLLPHLADCLTKPLVALGDHLSRSAQDSGEGGSIASSFLLGIATGLLWAPCAGPVLGLVLTGAALNGASASTTLLLLAYAAGAATSLAVALLIGGKVFTAMKRSLGAGEWIRRGLGGAMLLGVAAIAMGWDTGVLAQVSTVATGGLEEKLINALAPRPHDGAKRWCDDVAKCWRDVAERRGDDVAGRRGHVAEWRRDDVAKCRRHVAKRRCDDVDACRRGGHRDAGRRRHAAAIDGRRQMAQLPRADAGRAERQRGADRLLDLLLHQLTAQPALRRGMGQEIQGPGPGGDRRARPRIRLRARHRQRRHRREKTGHHLPGRHRQRLRHLARDEQPVLAGALLHRRAGPRARPPLRRGRVCAF